MALRRFGALAARHIRVLRMPQLSPAMKRGRVEELYVSVGQVVKSYDLVCRVSTDSLTHHSNSVVSHLQVEIIEEGVCNAILAKVGDTLEVGAPLLVLVDDVKGAADGRSIDLSELSSFQRALWQGYVMDKHDEGACGC